MPIARRFVYRLEVDGNARGSCFPQGPLLTAPTATGSPVSESGGPGKSHEIGLVGDIEQMGSGTVYPTVVGQIMGLGLTPSREEGG
jgi:hypothetical protein